MLWNLIKRIESLLVKEEDGIECSKNLIKRIEREELRRVIKKQAEESHKEN